MKLAERSLDQLGYVSRGRSRHRPRDATHLYGGPYPFVQTGDVKRAGLFLTDYDQTYSDEGLAQSKLWPAGTLCITIAANIAETAILGIDACFPDSVIGFIADSAKADVRYIKYMFDAKLKLKYRTFSQGVAQDNLSQEKLLSIGLTVPENVEDQRRLADVLAAYDELASNNRRRIELLERSARLLFEEWFVRLRYPGHEHDKVVDGIPQGWTRPPLSELCTLRAGDVFKPHLQGQPTGEFPFIKVGDFARSGNTICITSANNWLSQDSLESKKFRPFPPKTSVFAKIGEALKQNRVRYLVRHTLIDNNLMGAIPTIGVNGTYLYFLLATHDLATHASGAAVPFLSSRVLGSLTFLRPHQRIMDAFGSSVEPIMAQIAVLERQSTAASKARNLLLPRFIDGRIAV